MKITDNDQGLLFYIALMTFFIISILCLSCCKGKTTFRGVPKKPFYVIGVEPSGHDYRVLYIDADSNHFSFELDWLDHGKYKPGDIIK